MSDAAPKPRPKHANPESLFRALAALDLEAKAAARVGMTVVEYRELLADKTP